MLKQKLTFVEQQMFDLLLDSGDTIVKREELATAKPKPVLYNSNSVDVHIKNLRRKIKKEGYEIVTRRGIGYQLKKI